MKRLSMLFLLTTICIVCFTGKPQSQTFQERYEVAVDVTCKNQSVQRIIESHIKRELRSLQDVDVKASGKYTIAVVALEEVTESTRQETGGIAIATMFLEKSDLAGIRFMIKDDMLDTFDKYVLLLRLYYEPKLKVANWTTDNIDGWARQTIADFDIQMLEPVRRRKDKLEEELQKFLR